MPRLRLRLVILLGILGVAAAAEAQSAGDLARARALDRAGTEAFRAGHYDQAIASYQAAYELAPRPGVLFNLGRAYHKKGDAAHALEVYRRFLTETQKGPLAEEARGYVAELERAQTAESGTAKGPTDAAATAGSTPGPDTGPASAGPAAETSAGKGGTTIADAAPPDSSHRAAMDAVVLVPVTPEAAIRRWSFGPEVGLVLAGFDTSFTPSDNQVGFTAGGFVRYAALPWLAVRAELLFAQKGDSDMGVTERIDYLEVPLVLEASTHGLFLCAGAYGGIKLDATTNFDTKIPGTDAGLLFGAGYALPLGDGMLIFQARYDLGLSTIDDSYATKNRAFLFTLGYGFR